MAWAASQGRLRAPGQLKPLELETEVSRVYHVLDSLASCFASCPVTWGSSILLYIQEVITQRGTCLIHDTQAWSRSSACTAALGDKWLVGLRVAPAGQCGEGSVCRKQKLTVTCSLTSGRHLYVVPQGPSDFHLSLLAPAPPRFLPTRGALASEDLASTGYLS